MREQKVFRLCMEMNLFKGYCWFALIISYLLIELQSPKRGTILSLRG